MPHSLQVAVPANFSFKECLWFLDRSFDDCLHQVDATSVTKLLHINGEPLLLRIASGGSVLNVEVLNGDNRKTGDNEVVGHIGEWLDMRRDISPVRQLAESDPALRELIERYWGLRLISIPDLFEALCWSIIGQQINLKFAYKLKRNLVEAVGNSLSHGGCIYHAFPKPEQVLSLSVADLKQMQFSEQKANYLRIISQAFVDNAISKEQLLALKDTSEIIKHLTSIKGIGEWTANYVAMKCLRRMDAITYTDAGLLNGYKNLKQLSVKPLRAELEAFFLNFPGWQAYIVFYIWRSLS